MSHLLIQKLFKNLYKLNIQNNQSVKKKLNNAKKPPRSHEMVILHRCCSLAVMISVSLR